MTPQLQQAIKLLQLSRLELSQTLAQELQENPVLEEVSPDAADDAPEGDGAPGETSSRTGFSWSSWASVWLSSRRDSCSSLMAC